MHSNCPTKDGAECALASNSLHLRIRSASLTRFALSTGLLPHFFSAAWEQEPIEHT